MHKAKQELQHKQVDGNEQFHPHYFCDVSADRNCIDRAITTLNEWLDQTSRNMTWVALNVKKQRTNHEIIFPLENLHGAILKTFERKGEKVDC